jgi:hypothetical protein
MEIIKCLRPFLPPPFTYPSNRPPKSKSETKKLRFSLGEFNETIIFPFFSFSAEGVGG